MENAHTRKKQPELVRRALLDRAAELAVEQGLAAVTVQAVADAAGVTKGGFMHHFPSKQALIDAVFRELLDTLDQDLDARIEADPEATGAFTRAYLGSVLDMIPGASGGPWAALYVSMLADPDLRALWAGWYEARLERHQATDDTVQLAAVRAAADGIWLADLTGIALHGRAGLHALLLDMTLPHS
ncbi:TetR/AcrR family transcriptional regulator [Stappia sp. MMSF_3263]|uniref:TetR/AcrR family transcriptional regulator n=1 Tax=Stappia sp. MMSF_3263 TaxID=3046693 RepID=UPI00273D0726|nr:TetR/AcrR family transcriptional regulator [Stappia sp. MMSF_3263]